MSRRLSVQDATGIIAEIPGRGIIIAWGDTVPADATEGYAPGCIFFHTDGGDQTAAYLNEGTKASSNFDAISTV